MGRFVNPVPDIADVNGDPIVGAKLFFYSPGTTTLKTIYSDSGLGSATNNPQLADANGAYSGDIFLDGVYKVVQQDADGATIWTKDPVGDIIEGQFELWLTGNTYNIPDIVLGSNDEYYRSLVDGNQGSNPTITPEKWEQLTFGRLWNINITYSAGDSVYGSDGFVYLASTSSNTGNNPTTDRINWQSAAKVQFRKGADIASATALATGADGDYFDVTGTTTITSINTVVVGVLVKLHFDGALVLTHNATSLILPGGANITTTAGDEVEFIEYSTGNWRCTVYTKGGTVPGSINGQGALATLNTVTATEIDAGAVGQSEVATDAIGQAELKDATGIVSTTTTGVLLTLAGGQYGFYPQIRSAVSGSGIYEASMASSDDTDSASLSVALTATYNTRITLGNSAATTIFAQQRYFTASKPYDLGDGEVGRFIFALINNTTRKVESVYQATEAPWHYNGKTDIRGKLGKDGKKYRLRKDMSALPFTFNDAMGDPVKMQEYIAAFSSAELTKELITQEIYQRDMVDIPHPFTGNNLTGKTVVMLDPVCDLNHQLSEMCACHDEFDLNGLLHDGHLVIDNTGLNRVSPNGVMVPSFKWKNI